MLNMSTMSYIKLSITVFQEQQNGETNTLGLLTSFRHCWVICGGWWPKSFSSSIWTLDTQDSVIPFGVSCLLSRSMATSTLVHPGHTCPALPCPSLQALHDCCCCKQSSHQLLRLTLLPQVVVWLFGSNYFFFFLKNHLSCHTTRQESLRLW